jgi:hypothetical protein
MTPLGAAEASRRPRPPEAAGPRVGSASDGVAFMLGTPDAPCPPRKVRQGPAPAGIRLVLEKLSALKKKFWKTFPEIDRALADRP